jgi:hypothetical protein
MSALLQVVFLAVAFPYRVGRRYALDGLGRSLSTRRRRDRVMATVWIGGLTMFLLRDDGPAPTVPGSKGQPVPRTRTRE